MAERKKEYCNSTNVVKNKFYAQIDQKIHDDCHIKTLKKRCIKAQAVGPFLSGELVPVLPGRCRSLGSA